MIGPRLPNGVWFAHGLLHREDGPALVYPDGTREWWIDGEFLRREEA